MRQRFHNERGRLLAHRDAPMAVEAPMGGLQTLSNDAGVIGILYVPSGYQATKPAPLVVLLHGAGGTPQHGISLLQPYADALGLILLAPSSQWQTWDVIGSDYGPDVIRIGQMLTDLFSHYVIDAEHLAIGGFSDGASYALSLGLTNGDLFSHILAFSPGFAAPATHIGFPQIFVSHGTNDTVLPIARCSRQIVPRLEQKGYTVVYEEFVGPHTVPPAIARQAVDWFLANPDDEEARE